MAKCNVIPVFYRHLMKQQPPLPLEKNASHGQSGPNNMRGSTSLEDWEDPSRPLWRSACTSVRNERCYMQQQVHFPSQPAAVADRVLVRQTLAGDEGAF